MRSAVRERHCGLAGVAHGDSVTSKESDSGGDSSEYLNAFGQADRDHCVMAVVLDQRHEIVIPVPDMEILRTDQHDNSTVGGSLERYVANRRSHSISGCLPGHEICVSNKAGNPRVLRLLVEMSRCSEPVSYTHLTLPTIYSV